MAVNPLAGLAGGETSLLRLLPQLERRGWSAVVTVPAAGRLCDRARAVGIPVRRLPLGPPERRTPVALAGLAVAPLALRGADVVLLNGLSTQRIAPALRAPAVLRVNNPLDEPPRAWRRRDHWDRVAVVVADSQHVARECARHGAPAERIVVAYPAAWAEGDPPGARAAPPDGERVLFVGTLEERKGAHVLLAAARSFLAERPNARLTLVGDGVGRYAREVHGAAAELGARVEGFQADAAAAIAQHDVVVVPSLAEPFGTVAAEAAAAGRPAVASAVGGLAEVVRDGETGLLVPPGDPDALAAAVGALLDDAAPRRRLGARALELAGRFSPTAYANSVEQALRRALEPTR